MQGNKHKSRIEEIKKRHAETSQRLEQLKNNGSNTGNIATDVEGDNQVPGYRLLFLAVAWWKKLSQNVSFCFISIYCEIGIMHAIKQYLF